jgi:hypothetical protein
VCDANPGANAGVRFPDLLRVIMPTTKPKPTAQHLEWLVTSRSKIQAQMLRLQLAIENADEKISNNPKAADMFAWLLGASFSLWRAVFQAQTLDPVANMDGAKKLLLEVITTNTVTFQLELNSWSYGFYLNNARFRLLRMYREADGYHEPATDSKTAALEKAISALGYDPTKAWDEVFDFYLDMMGIFGRHVSKL